MFENEYTFCLWMFAPSYLLWYWRDLDSSDTGVWVSPLHVVHSFWFNFCNVIHYCSESRSNWHILYYWGLHKILTKSWPKFYKSLYSGENGLNMSSLLELIKNISFYCNWSLSYIKLVIRFTNPKERSIWSKINEHQRDDFFYLKRLCQMIW